MAENQKDKALEDLLERLSSSESGPDVFEQHVAGESDLQKSDRQWDFVYRHQMTITRDYLESVRRLNGKRAENGQSLIKPLKSLMKVANMVALSNQGQSGDAE
mmetsp:Transcript_28920/g.48645  ORF Transcript_28920/g.48645 Transcript_28920/m.48645 type:complete len:103 (+) Transcript_28920:1454-1762(+)